MANQTQYDNALRNSGGDTSNPMFMDWMSKYGGNNGVGAVPYGDVAGNVNSFMTDQAIAPFLQNLPGYAGMVGQRSQNIGAELSGAVPQDVMQQIQQEGAERGVASGSPGSPNANAAMLRALGLNSLKMQQQGSRDLSQSIADTPVPQLLNPMSLYVPETMGRMGLDATRAGMAAGGGGSGFPMGGGGGFSGGGGVSGIGRTPAIPRWSAGASPSISGTGFLPPGNSAMSDFGSMDINQPWMFPNQASQSYWDSPMGLQNPNRPADEEYFNPDWMTPAVGFDDQNPDWMFGSDVGTNDYSYLE